MIDLPCSRFYISLPPYRQSKEDHGARNIQHLSPIVRCRLSIPLAWLSSSSRRGLLQPSNQTLEKFTALPRSSKQTVIVSILANFLFLTYELSMDYTPVPSYSVLVKAHVRLRWNSQYVLAMRRTGYRTADASIMDVCTKIHWLTCDRCERLAMLALKIFQHQLWNDLHGKVYSYFFLFHHSTVLNSSLFLVLLRPPTSLLLHLSRATLLHLSRTTLLHLSRTTSLQLSRTPLLHLSRKRLSTSNLYDRKFTTKSETCHWLHSTYPPSSSTRICNISSPTLACVCTSWRLRGCTMVPSSVLHSQEHAVRST